MNRTCAAVAMRRTGAAAGALAVVPGRHGRMRHDHRRPRLGRSGPDRQRPVGRHLGRPGQHLGGTAGGDGAVRRVRDSRPDGSLRRSGLGARDAGRRAGHDSCVARRAGNPLDRHRHLPGRSRHDHFTGNPDNLPLTAPGTELGFGAPAMLPFSYADAEGVFSVTGLTVTEGQPLPTGPRWGWQLRRRRVNSRGSCGCRSPRRAAATSRTRPVQDDFWAYTADGDVVTTIYPDDDANTPVPVVLRCPRASPSATATTPAWCSPSRPVGPSTASGSRAATTSRTRTTRTRWSGGLSPGPVVRLSVGDLPGSRLRTCSGDRFVGRSRPAVCVPPVGLEPTLQRF